MNIFFSKDKSRSSDMAKFVGVLATTGIMLQLVLAGFFSAGNISAQEATTSLTVNKVVEGGPNVAADFALFVDGMPVTNGVATTTLEAGLHTVSETNLPGYTAAFSGDCNASGEVTLVAGVDATCTITNTFATTTATTSSLTVTKVVEGGTMEVDDFPLFVDGIPVMSGVATTTLGAGDFVITETNLPGYTATFSGDCNADGEITLELGDDLECTVTNTFATTTATSSSLTVTKNVVGGTATSGSFTLFVDGVPIANGVATTTLDAGTFSITETNLPGYTATFSGDCNATGVVTLALGDDLECIITNTFATTTATTSSLTVTKNVVGGPLDASAFNLFVDGIPVTNGVATTTLGAGVFTITEADLAGYTPTFSGDCNTAGIVNLELGDDLECTITNTFATTTATTSSLTVIKNVVGGTSTSSDFALFVDGMPVTNGVATTTLGAGVFTITEANLPGYTASFSGDCNAAGVVALTLGTEAECTITNTFATSTATTSSLTVTKVVVGGTVSASEFPLFVNGVSVTNGVATTTLGAGTFTVTETSRDGYTTTFSGACNASGVVTLSLGVEAECVITNTFTGGGGGGGGGQRNRGLERAAAVTPPPDNIAGNAFGLTIFQNTFTPPGLVLGAQSSIPTFGGQVLGVQSAIPGMPSTGGDPMDGLQRFLGMMLVVGLAIISYPLASRMFSGRSEEGR